MAEDRCCCGVCHVKTGTWIIGIVEFGFGVGDVANAIVHAVRSKEGTDAARYVIAGQGVMTVIWLFMIILLFIGLHKNSPLLILPHLIVTAFYVMLVVASSIWLVVTGLPIIAALLFVCAVLIIFGLLWVEWRCYKYISTIA
uniref:DUF7027 domain-containing protein n=1 Tax=Plectus sambesii TaxID=2011161 RepID=A0A914UL26_9BILA